MKRTLLAAAASLAFASHPADASEAAMARLMECMKMPAASAQQNACMQQVESLRKAAPPAMKTMAATAPRAKVATSPAGISKEPPKTVEVPPEFKRAAAEVGLAGAPAQMKSSAAPGGSMVGGIGGGITVGDLKGLDLESAMMAIQSQRANLLEQQLKTQIDAVQQRNDQIAKLNDQINQLRKKPPADEAQIGKLKAQIDALNNSQQMDMLKLQSLTNKRNEAFDLMTNFIKKMADSRSSILGNMR